MKYGMLWFDNRLIDINLRLLGAVEYFQNKYNLVPDICKVNFSMVKDKYIYKGDGFEILVVPGTRVQNNHFWIGVKNEVSDAS